MNSTLAVVTAPMKIDYIQRPLRPVGDFDILVKTDAVGLCHSDMSRFLGSGTVGLSKEGFREALPVEYPCPIGHEPVGTVVEIGKKVTRFAVGDHVTGHMAPSFQTYQVVPETSMLFKLPPMEQDYRLCVAEPLGCVKNIINNILAQPSEYIAIIGCGVMGLMTLAGLRGCGAKEIVAIDLAEPRLELARKYGATQTINPRNESVQDAAYRITEGKFFDTILEITGGIKGLETACSIIKFAHVNGLQNAPYHGRGRIIMSSVYDKNEILPTRLAHWMMLRTPILYSVHPSSGEDVLKNDQDGVQAFISGQIPMYEMITHKTTFDKLQEGFEWLHHPPANYLKGIVFFD